MQQDNSKTSRIGLLSLILIAVAVTWNASVGAEPRETTDDAVREGQFGSRQSLEVIAPIVITPSTPEVVLADPVSACDAGASGPSPSGARGSLSFRVESYLPEWGVYAKSMPLVGPEGVLPPNRVSVRTDLSGDEVASLDQAVPVVVGDMRLPVKETSIEIGIQPQWEDTPGQYEGEILLMPYMPAGAKEVPDLEDGGGFFMEGTQSIGIQMVIPETMALSVSHAGIEFTTGLGPGIYEAGNEVTFEVRTNARVWRVDCKAEPLRSEKGEIPASRVGWERLDRYGRSIAEGRFGDYETIVSGLGSSRAFQVRLRFKVEVTPDDVAGQYQGKVSFFGITG